MDKYVNKMIKQLAAICRLQINEQEITVTLRCCDAICSVFSSFESSRQISKNAARFLMQFHIEVLCRSRGLWSE